MASQAQSASDILPTNNKRVATLSEHLHVLNANTVLQLSAASRFCSFFSIFLNSYRLSNYAPLLPPFHSSLGAKADTHWVKELSQSQLEIWSRKADGIRQLALSAQSPGTGAESVGLSEENWRRWIEWDKTLTTHDRQI